MKSVSIILEKGVGIFENKDKSKIQNDEEIDDLDFDEMNDVWDELDV